jgi:spore coat protein U-like protein
MRSSSLFLALVGIAMAGSAVAAPSPLNGDFTVTASVAESCRIESDQNIAFGAYDPITTHASTALDANGRIVVRCVRGTSGEVTLDDGANQAAGSTCAAPQRQMTNGGTGRLGYQIYQDSPGGTVWGCDATNDRPFTGDGPNTDTIMTTYGRVPAGQDVETGSYTDTVAYQITF